MEEQFAESPAMVQQLCLLSDADVLGRIAPDTRALQEQVQLCRLFAEESGLLTVPMHFAPSMCTASVIVWSMTKKHQKGNL